MSIPVVDLSHFTGNDPELKESFVSQLGKAFEETGFVAVKNHGINDALTEHLYRHVKEFFALPAENKRGYQRPDLAGQRGFTSFGTEHAKGYDDPDLKEFFQLGQELNIDDPMRKAYPENVFVDEVPDFTPTMIRAYKAFEVSGAHLLSAIALYLELNENYFDDYVMKGNSILRAIHYPPIVSEPASAIRAEQHEDINLITLLIGSSADGLQILSKSGEWIAVTSLPGQIVVNVGDMLQRLTNNQLRSTTHRVVNPPPDKWHTPRFSIPFFLHPKTTMSLACLDSCISDSQPKAYDDITAGQYLDQRLAEIGLKK